MNTVRLHSVVSRGVLALLLAAATACSGEREAAPPRATAAGIPPAADAPIPDTASPLDALPNAVKSVVDKPFTGDFDEMVKRRAVRVAVTFNRTHDFIDKGQERGLTYEALKSAAYNAGPGRLRQLRRETETRGLDPNVWFNNVERVASERIGRETVTYVSNIYKYYITY